VLSEQLAPRWGGGEVEPAQPWSAPPFEHATVSLRWLQEVLGRLERPPPASSAHPRFHTERDRRYSL
jgi:hypothetical protein